LVYAAREWCGIKASVVAEHLDLDASMISRLHAAYVENRDNRSELELQRWLKTKSTTPCRTPHPIRLCWFLAFNARIQIHPVMVPDDLAKAGRAIEQAVKKYS